MIEDTNIVYSDCLDTVSTIPQGRQFSEVDRGQVIALRI